MSKSICLCMMVKNEGHVLADALRSVKPIIDSYCISDTGSTDNTKEIIRQELADIPGEIFDLPFKNYGFNRTAVFDKAKDKADYMLVLDADDIFHADKGFKKEELTADAYEIEINLASSTYRQLRLFRTNHKWEYRGAVHEVPWTSPASQCVVQFLKSCNVKSYGTGATSKDPEKYLNHARMLEEEIKTSPQCDLARTTFYIAQSYSCARKWDEAIRYYKIRATMGAGTNIGEVYSSYYCLGHLYNNIGSVDNAIASFLNAYNEAPYRAEPLYHLCRLLRLQNKFQSGYAFGMMAVGLKATSANIFNEPLLYGYPLWDELSLCAFYTGRKTEANRLFKRILKTPDVPQEVKDRVKMNTTFIS